MFNQNKYNLSLCTEHRHARTHVFTDSHSHTLKRQNGLFIFCELRDKIPHRHLYDFISRRPAPITIINSFHADRAYINRVCIDFVCIRHAIVHCVYARQMTYAVVDALTNPIGSNEMSIPVAGNLLTNSECINCIPRKAYTFSLFHRKSHLNRIDI